MSQKVKPPEGFHLFWQMEKHIVRSHDRSHLDKPSREGKKSDSVTAMVDCYQISFGEPAFQYTMIMALRSKRVSNAALDFKGSNFMYAA